ncbi:uncharacterized protein LOC143300534 isoform X2 [Babylonia areolata]|uniref:uncharacterized protein LOC143300534 isoform X2 n=1 Tax=Babylonia areolata TaxID=304850 RepID=UPI003FD3AFF8
MEHYELVQEMGAVERMTTQERLKHARKRRAQQMKKWTQYERQLEKENTKKKKNQDKQPLPRRTKKSNRGNVKFTPNIALLEAAARNDLNEVKILLESGVSPDVTNEDGLTALHQCCIDDSEEMMKLLLDYNANVNACDSEMWTPLHAAATCGHMMLCKYLIDRGAELLAVNADGNMPYDICEDEITLDHIETEMAKRGITQEQIDVTRLATEHKMLADVKKYASTGGDLEMVDHLGASLLHIAAANGYFEVAEFLLDNHVSVDKRDNESWQPIHAAAYWAQQEILELLVENGADLDSKTKSGETPFDLCEEPDLKQKILDMKDEIETKRSIRQQRLGSSRKQRVSSRNLGHSTDSLYSSNTSLNVKTSVSASMRRSSMRGEKSQLFKKEHKEEALHFGLNLMPEDDSLMEVEDEHDAVPSTDLDAVTVVVTGEDDPHPPFSSPGLPPTQEDTYLPPAPAGVTITINSQPMDSPPTSPHTAQSQTMASTDSQKPPSQLPSQGRSRPSPSDTVAVTQNSLGETGPKPSAMTQNTSDTSPKPKPQNASGPPRSTHASQVLPRQPVYPMPGHERRPSGSTLSDLKRQRSNSRESLLEIAVQSMFLESVQGGRQQQGNSVPGREKAKNGHHHNNNAMHYTASDGQLRRFVAPTTAPVVGGDEGKQKCCVIL